METIYMIRWKDREARRYIRALERGEFKRLLGKHQAQTWYKFLERHASIPHTKRIGLRLTPDHGNRWYLWVIYAVVSTTPLEFKLETWVVPTRDTLLERPEELEDIPIFEA